VTLHAAFFYLYALVAIAGAIGLVSARQLVHAVMCFFATLVAIAGIFLLLGSEFLAAMQLFVYGGAMTVLVLFALMFTGSRPVPERSARSAVPWLAGAVLLTFFGMLAAALWSAGWAISPAKPMDVAAIATILFSRLVVPFEIAGLALTIALIGAIILAREDDVVDALAKREGDA
jgi:NADH:ubiquinone oxidoreductase subunit 6 (subunit J)